VLSAAAYGGVLAYTVTRSSAAAPAVAGIGALGALVLVLLLVRASAEAVPWPLGLLGVAYAIALVVRGGSGVDEGAPLVAVGLLLCGELAAWSVGERLSIPAERGVVAARAAALGGLAAASLAVAALVIALAAAPAGEGLAWTVLGAAAAVAVVGVAVALARRA
jgi:hypothetical protein